MSIRILCATGAAALFLTTQGASAVEPLSAQELGLHCAAYPDEEESTDGQYCIRYIQGFIDGAVATDVRVMLNVEADNGRKETFMERAFRTRHGSRAQLDKAAHYAEFCLGEPVPLREIVGKVVWDLLEHDDGILDGILARTLVYKSLRTHYPCKD